MPGICGGVNTNDCNHFPDLSAAMLRRMRTHDGHLEEQHVDREAGLALGRVSLGFVNTAKQPVSVDGGRYLAVMDGELYDKESLRRELQDDDGSLAEAGDAELLARVWRAEGEEGVRRLNGSFSAAIWDSQRRVLHLLNDRFGTRPLYYCRVADGFSFASSISALLADSAVSRAINPAGLAQFFTFGHYLRDDTSLEGVRVAPAAACISWHADRGDLAVNKYWRVGDASAVDASADHRDLLERIDMAFKQAVDRRVVETNGLGLALSGGLDARTILGVMDIGQTPLKTLCLGMAGSLDHRCAGRLAELAGCDHHNHVLDSGFMSHFRQHLQEMVRLTDGQYLSQCIVMPTFPLYQRLGIQVLLRGHAGELMHMQKAYNYSLDREAMAIDDVSQLKKWLFRRLQAYMFDGVEKPVFAARYQEDLKALAERSLGQDVEETAGAGSPLQQIWRLFLTQRLRRETVLSLVKFRSVVEPRLPYLDNELIDLLLSAPPQLKLAEEIQSHILRKRRPEFLNVVNANTGARLGAGPMARRFAGLKLKVLAKVGAPGYQPYERLGLWLRRELAPTVKEVLLSEQCLDRGVFSPEGVRDVIDGHGKGRNHTFLILAMMIFEMGQRHLLEEAQESQLEPAIANAPSPSAS